MESESKERIGGARGWGAVRPLMASLIVALMLATWGIGASAREEAEQRVDLNRASVEELMSLPGVGASKAQAIVEHRRTAPFRRVEELLQVKGIGDSIYAGLRDRITVSGEAASGGARAGAPESAAAGGQD